MHKLQDLLLVHLYFICSGRDVGDRTLHVDFDQRANLFSESWNYRLKNDSSSTMLTREVMGAGESNNDDSVEAAAVSQIMGLA